MGEQEFEDQAAPRRRKRPKPTADEVEAKVRDAQWISPTELAALFDVSSSTADRMLRRGVKMGARLFAIRFRWTVSDDRVCHPGDVLEVLEESRRLYSALDPQPGDADGPAAIGPAPER